MMSLWFDSGIGECLSHACEDILMRPQLGTLKMPSQVLIGHDIPDTHKVGMRMVKIRGIRGFARSVHHDMRVNSCKMTC